MFELFAFIAASCCDLRFLQNIDQEIIIKNEIDADVDAVGCRFRI